LNQKEIEDQLSTQIDRKISSRIVKYYFEAKEAYYKEDPEKTSLKCGKFAEQVLRGLRNIVTGQVERSVNFERFVQDLENSPNTFGDEIRIIIPRILRGIYTLRNKRSVAHSGDIDPGFIDAGLCIAGADWTLSELLRKFHNYSEDQIEAIMVSLIRKKVPIVQKIGDDIVVLDKSVSGKTGVLLILYTEYPKWVEKEKISECLIKYETKNNINTGIRRAESDRYLFQKNGKCIITNAEIAVIEEEFKEKFLG